MLSRYNLRIDQNISLHSSPFGFFICDFNFDLWRSVFDPLILIMDRLSLLFDLILNFFVNYWW